MSHYTNRSANYPKKALMAGILAASMIFGDISGGECLTLSHDSPALARNHEPDTADNLNPGKEFMSDAGSKHQIITLPSGLQYLVIRPGKGDQPGANDIVTVHHRGWTLAGKEIGNTYRSGEPQSFPASFAIPAWSEALQLMRVGAIWKLFVPPELGYGEKGWLGIVGPDETLVYELGLVDIPVRSR